MFRVLSFQMKINVIRCNIIEINHMVYDSIMIIVFNARYQICYKVSTSFRNEIIHFCFVCASCKYNVISYMNARKESDEVAHGL